MSSVLSTLIASRSPLRHLPLEQLHQAHGATMQPFAGWSMPVQYSLGILGEHRHTRAAAGLFDVSHMGQVLLRARSGDLRDAALALETLLPVDVVSLRPGRQRYAFFSTPSGGVSDDLMIANLGDTLLLVVNAARVDADVLYLKERLSATCSVEVLSNRVLLALQGPQAFHALASWVPEVAAMRFMDARIVTIADAACFISRSGYTGEDGFELSLPVVAAEFVVDRLLRQSAVALIGLGARDTLRLEAGLCLYGHELSADSSPVEAGLEWAIQPVRRTGGAREGGFPGADVILRQLSQGVTRRRVGLRSESRPVRDGAALYGDMTSQTAVGQVTSGTFAPTANYPVAMGYVPAAAAQPGNQLFADVRGQRLAVTVSDLPFVPHRYHR